MVRIILGIALVVVGLPIPVLAVIDMTPIGNRRLLGEAGGALMMLSLFLFVVPGTLLIRSGWRARLRNRPVVDLPDKSPSILSEVLNPTRVFFPYDYPRVVGNLPAICMRCGKPATRTKELLFGREKQAKVIAPLCDGHPLMGSWPIVFFGGLLLLLALCGLGALLRNRIPNEWLAIPFITVLVIWFVFERLVAFLSFRNGGVGDDGVDVIGVSRVFVAALANTKAERKEPGNGPLQ